MEKKITCFIPFSDKLSAETTIASLNSSDLVSKIFVVSGYDQNPDFSESNVSVLRSDGFGTSATVKKILENTVTDYILLYNKSFSLDTGRFSLDRMIQVCELTGAGMVYSDYYENKNTRLTPHPVIDYQEGSLRDDFNFGSVILYETSAFTEACGKINNDYKFAGLYDLRLKISEKYKFPYIFVVLILILVVVVVVILLSQFRVSH